ncbi:hypothetical protein [Thermodesulfitimonas sp.]
MVTPTATLVFLAVLALGLTVYQAFRAGEEAVVTRATALLGGEGPATLKEQELRQPLYYRVVKPLLRYRGHPYG